MFKQILACLMVLLTLVSYLPPMASAEETQPQEETTLPPKVSAEETQPQGDTTEGSAIQPSAPETVPAEPTAAAEETAAPTQPAAPTEETAPNETAPWTDGAVASGECGDNLTWSVDAEDGTLIITGTGAMWNYEDVIENNRDWHTSAPWYEYSPKKLVLEEGITYIGSYAFLGCSLQGSLILPKGVTRIGDFAFRDCSGLTSLVIPEGVTSIGVHAFACCSWTSVTIPEGVTSVGGAAFYGCTSLVSVKIPSTVTDIHNCEGFPPFEGCSSLTNFYVDERNPVYASVDGILFNKGLTALVIYPAGKENTDYKIPEGVTSIGGFSGCENLISVTIPEGVTSIGGFGGCSSLTSIEMPKSATSIRRRAFDGCTSLSSVTIPEGVTSIGEFAFMGCSGLTKVTIPKGVTSIGERAFEGCSSLTSITIPKSVTSIGARVFWCNSPSLQDVYYTGSQAQWDEIKIEYDNQNLFNATLHLNCTPDSVIASGECGDSLTWSIDDDGTLTISGTDAMWDYTDIVENSIIHTTAPWYAYSPVKLILEEGISHIGDWAFEGCDGLTGSLTLPESLTSIGHYAFSGSGFTGGLTLPKGLTSIGSSAFSGWSSLTSVTIPQSVTSIGINAFGFCENLENIFVNVGNTAYTSVDGVLFNKDLTTLVIYPIGKKDTTYQIPEGVTEISGYAFGSCNNLTSVTIPEGVTVIGAVAFLSCSNLTSVTIPESVTEIGMGAFNSCLSLTSITIPEGVTYIDEFTFNECHSLTSVVIPRSVTRIALSAFAGCNGLKDVYYAGSQSQWDRIGISDGNDSLLSADIHFDPTGSTGSGKCGDNLTWSVDAEGTLTISGTGAMQDYTSVSENGNWRTTAPWYTLYPVKLVLNEGISYIGHYAFLGCSLTGSVTIPKSVTRFGWEVFSGCKNLTNVTIPASLTNIRYSAFNGCTGLTSVTIPEGVSTIDGFAFAGCTGLTSVVIPKSVTRILWGAFSGCTSLKDVYYAGDQSRWNGIVISDSNDPLLNAEIHFDPTGSTGSGECGENLTWRVDADGTLTISGTGAMQDYDAVSEDNIWHTTAPWHAYYPTKLVFEEGITYIGSYAFYKCGFTGGLTLPESLTSIGEAAFLDCSGFTGNLTLPKNLTNVSDWAFTRCSGFRGGLTLPEGLTSIGNYAFWDCSGFTGSLTIPEGVTSIGDHAFDGCNSFTGSLTLPKSLNSIGYGAFQSCYGFTGSLTLPENLTSIGARAFYWCTGFSGSLTLPRNLTSIENRVFGGCSGFTGSLVLPESLTSIDYFAFENCSGFTGNLVLPESLTSIGTGAFWGCSGFTGSLTIPKGLTSMDSAFGDCTGLSNIFVDEGNACYTSVDGVLFNKDCTSLIDYPAGKELPDYEIPESVTSIGRSAFRDCVSLTSVTIPGSVTKIEWCAFGGCISLEDVYYVGNQAQWNKIEIEDNNEPLLGAKLHLISGSGTCGENLTWIVDADGTLTISGTGAMQDYRGTAENDSETDVDHTMAPWYACSPTKLVLEEGITYIGRSAFAGCGFTGSLTLPESLTGIGFAAFINCHGFTGSLTLPKGLTTIGGRAFENCDGFTGSLVLPVGLTSIPDLAFDNCSGFTGSLILPEGLTDIGYCAFGRCSGFTGSLILPEGLTTIGYCAFTMCSGLTSVTIPASVTRIIGMTFYSCSSLTNIAVGERSANFASVDGVLFSKDHTALIAYPAGRKDTAYQIPDGVTSMEFGAFSGCKNLTSVVIPEGVTKIENTAFLGCSGLISITIPEGVTSIEEAAFDGCSSLTSVAIPKSVTKIAWDAFAGCGGLKDVHYAGTQSQWNGIDISDGNDPLLNAVIHFEPATSGKCGENLTWTLTYDGVLTISGTGKMTDYPNFPDVPWYDDREKIVTAVIEPGVTNICSFAFFGCKNLTSVTIPEGVTSIGSYAFNACNLTSMEIPASVTAIGTLDDSALGGAGRNLTGYFVDEQNTAYTSVDGILFSKDGTVLIAYPQGKNDTSYSIPESVTCIASDAFGASRLTSVTIPESVTSIRLGAFFGCDGLTSITIPKSVVSIGDLALADCANLSNIYADEKNTVYTSVDGILFNKEKTTLAIYPSGRKTTSYKIPEGVTSIGDYAFDGCGLTSVTIPGSVTSIGSSAFSDCASLKDVYYAGTQTQWDEVQIGDYNGSLFKATLHFKFANSVAFGSCGDNLTWDIDADRTLTISGTGAMVDYEYTTDDNGGRHTTAPWYAYSPTKLVIEDGITYIGHYAFLGCGLTDSVTIPETVTRLGWESFGLCSSLTDVTIPASLTKIGYGTFNGCTGLTSVVIPEGVPMIDGIAFAGCTGLTSIVIPERVTKIEWGAFRECGSLRDVYYAGNKAQWDEIEIAEYNEPLLNAAIHFNSVGPCPELTLDREYISLDVGAEPVQLLTFPEYARKAVVWSVENPDGVNVIEVNDDGCVTPLNAGTAYVVASLNTGDGTLTARCRVDVTAKGLDKEVLGVDLGTKRVTTELYSTDYAKIDILLLLEQNEVALFAMPVDNGSAITGAYLEDENARQFFDLRVKDDRQLLLVPTQEALDNAKSVKSSYSSKIVVLVNGVEYHTDDAVTISVRKTMPRLRAASLTFNPFYTEESQALTITGGTVTKVEGTTPDWLTMDGTKLTLNNAPKSGSANLNLLVYTAEWAIPVSVRVSVRLSYRAPGLRLSAASVILSETDSLGVTLKLTAGRQSLEELNVKSVTLPAGFEETELDLYTGEIALVPVGEIPTGRQTVRVSFYGTDSVLDLPLTVNKRTPTLRLSKTSVSLNAELGDSMTLKVTATPADLDLTKVTVTNPSEALEVTPVNENGEFTVTVKQGTATRAAYALTVQAPTGRAVKLTVRTLAAGQKVTMSLRAVGSIDLTFPEKGAALQPTIRNYSGELENVGYTLALRQGRNTVDVAFEDYLTVGEDGLIHWNGTGSLESGNICQITMTGELPNGTVLSGTVQVRVTETPVILRLSKASLSLNKRLEEKTQVTVTTSTRGYTLGDVELQVTDNKNVPSDGLTAAYENGLLTLSVNEKTVYGGSYKVQLWVTPRRVTTLMVRIPAEKNSAVTMTARARGGIDVIRDASEVVVTPIYRNCLDGASLKKQVKVTWAQDGRNYSQDVTEDFILTWAQDGTLHVSKVPGKELALTGKYRLEILCEGMEKEAYAALSVKCGTARFTVASVSLYAKDANDMARLTITTTDKTVNTLERVELKDARLKGTYEVLDLGGGQFALRLIPGAKAKTGTVTLNLFCEGNTTEKPSGTVSVKVEIR